MYKLFMFCKLAMGYLRQLGILITVDISLVIKYMINLYQSTSNSFNAIKMTHRALLSDYGRNIINNKSKWCTVPFGDIGAL